MNIEVSAELGEVLEKFAAADGKTVSAAVEEIVGGFIRVMLRERDADLVKHRLAELDEAIEAGMATVKKQEDLLARARQRYIDAKASELAYLATEHGVQAVTNAAAVQAGLTS